VQIIRDQLAQLPANVRVLLILSKHGHPFKKETLDKRGPEYRVPLETEMRNLMGTWGGPWELVWSDDEFADEYWDPGNTKVSTFSAYRKAINEGFDYAIEVPTDFIAENTDLMFLHAIKKFKAFSSYDPNEPVPYPDWEKPLVRSFSDGKTTGIYAGCPVGKYRKYIVESAVNSITAILNNV
jgi:hypothetical protein